MEDYAHNEAPRALPRAYRSVDSTRTTKDGELRCTLHTKADEAKYGKWADAWNKLTEAPIFYAANPDGTFEKLGTPDFIVFPCIKKS